MKKLIEDEVPTNNAGSGQIEGIGVGPKGEPGKTCIKKKKNLKDIVLKRKTPPN